MSLPIKLSLPEHFLREEVRCGYTVPEKLKKIWAVELDLLNELLRVCKKHNIKVQVFAGTLLGAVRHKGFIPWDDDLDVALTRAEFEKLCKIAPYEFKRPYFFQTGLSDRRFFLAYGRLRNSLTTGVVCVNRDVGYNNGIYIDVFVLDGMPSTQIVLDLQMRLKQAFIKPLTLYNQDRPRNRSLREKLLRLPRPFVRLLPYSFWYKLFRLVSVLYNDSPMRLGDLLSEIRTGVQKYWIYRGECDDLSELTFENLQVPVPTRYEEVLSRIYGDWKKFPPESDRGKWHDSQIYFNPELPYEEYFKGLSK